MELSTPRGMLPPNTERHRSRYLRVVIRKRGARGKRTQGWRVPTAVAVNESASAHGFKKFVRIVNRTLLNRRSVVEPGDGAAN